MILKLAKIGPFAVRAKRKCTIFGHFRRRQAAKMGIFELSSISKKLKRFRTFERCFEKQLNHRGYLGKI